MSALERATEILETARTFSGDAFLTSNYTDDSIIKGYGYQCRRVLTVSNTGTYKIVFDATALPYNYGLYLLPLSMGGTGGPVLVSTYRITSYSNGSILPSNYINYVTKRPATVVIKHGVTSSDTAGDDLREYIFGATGNPQQVARSGTGGGSVPLVLPRGAIICAEIDNNYSGDIQFGMDIVWFETPWGQG